MLIRSKFEGYARDGSRRYPIDMGNEVDTSAQDAVAAQAVKVSEDQLAFIKKIWEDEAPTRAAAAKTAQDVSAAQLEGMNTQTALAKDYDAYNKEVFRPLEKSIVADANAYDTAERRDAEGANAVAAVGSNADAVRATLAREASARAVDPSSGNFAATMGVMGNQQIAQQAAAGNAAIKGVETMGRALKMDAASLGRNLPAQQATAAAAATAAGTNAAQNGLLPVSMTNQSAGVVNQGYNGAQQGLNTAGGIYSSSTNAKAKADDSSGLFGALGQVGGAAIMKFSDKNMKEDRKPVSDEKALHAIRGLPEIDTYKYKEGSPAADGGQTHAGNMAQDVKANLGEPAAPGGKVVNLEVMASYGLAGLKALDKKVTELTKVFAAKGLPA